MSIFMALTPFAGLAAGALFVFADSVFMVNLVSMQRRMPLRAMNSERLCAVGQSDCGYGGDREVEIKSKSLGLNFDYKSFPDVVGRTGFH